MDGVIGTAPNAHTKRQAEEPLAAPVAKAVKVEGQEQQRAPDARNGGEEGLVQTRAVPDKPKSLAPPKLKPKNGDNKPMTCPEHPDKVFQSHADFRFLPPSPSLSILL